MKKILFISLLLICAGMAQAQLYVNQDGITNAIRINVETNGGSDDKGINVYLSKQSQSYTGINSEINGYTSDSNSNRYGIGIMGTVKKCAAGNYGVYGYVPTSTGNFSNYGAAIYGTTTTRKTLNGLYAGFFDGMVGVRGNVFATGTIQGSHIVNALPNPGTPDMSLLSRGSSNVIDQLSGLQAGSFYINPKKLYSTIHFDGGESTERNTEVEETVSEATSRKHYGLSADQLKEIYPDLVYDNEDGTQSINYVEMVPILVQAINELSAKVAELEGKDSTVKKVSAKTTAINDVDGSVEVLALGQNKPNPFGTSTEIEVSVPESVQSAFVYVYDLQGKKVQQVNLTARGKQTVQLNAADLTDGMYLYSLIADGKVVETRRMIVDK